MKYSIVTSNLTKSYKLYKQPSDRLKESLSITKKMYHENFKANDSISFKIKKGEVVGIIGRNGCGKSTLLKMITGVLNPTSGSVKVSGKITALLELGAGFNPEMTGLENLYLSASISGYSKKEIEKKIEKIIDFAEIGNFIHQPLKTYSSGMKARLGFAFAINTEPEVLIIDEALSVGDAAFQRKCYAKIEHMCKSDSVTVLFVSHGGGVIKQLCSRAIFLHDGKIVLDGEPKKVVNLYEKFIGSKETNKEEIQLEYSKMLKNEQITTKKTLLSSYYNPNIKSKSLVKLPINGAKIYAVKLLDKNHNLVNIIKKNETYQYTYKIKFFNTYNNIKVAMQLKNISGLNLGGKSSSLNNIILEEVNKNDIYQITWKFINILNPGEYFFNCGVNQTEFGKKKVLHRVVDAYMFKVIDDSKCDSNGYIDFSFNLYINKLKDSD